MSICMHPTSPISSRSPSPPDTRIQSKTIPNPIRTPREKRKKSDNPKIGRKKKSTYQNWGKLSPLPAPSSSTNESLSLSLSLLFGNTTGVVLLDNVLGLFFSLTTTKRSPSLPDFLLLWCFFSPWPCVRGDRGGDACDWECECE